MGCLNITQSDRPQSNIKTVIAHSSPHHKAIAPNQTSKQ
jgi:hypothetical protein